MKLNYLMGAVAACGLLAGAAYAQPASSPNDTTSGSSGSMSAPSTQGSGSMSSGAATSNRTAPADTATSSGSDASANSAMSSGQNASATAPSGTMQPIPDTHANRQQFGGPNSAAGRRTTPKGN